MPINSQFTPPQGAAAPNPAIPSGAFSALFPEGVAAAELRLPGDASLLHPEEALSVARAVPTRVGEFAAGRLCARRALAEFNIHDFALETAPDRTPIWPRSMVGSIAHTRGFCAAVAAERRRFTSLGIDVEAAGEVKPELWRHICVEPELEWLGSLPAELQATAATLVFSAKEAFYKCQYPVTGERLRFADVCVRLAHPEAGAWSGPTGAILVFPMRPAPGATGVASSFLGAYRVHEGYVFSGFYFPAQTEVILPTESPSKP